MFSSHCSCISWVRTEAQAACCLSFHCTNALTAGFQLSGSFQSTAVFPKPIQLPSKPLSGLMQQQNQPCAVQSCMCCWKEEAAAWSVSGQGTGLRRPHRAPWGTQRVHRSCSWPSVPCKWHREAPGARLALPELPLASLSSDSSSEWTEFWSSSAKSPRQRKCSKNGSLERSHTFIWLPLILFELNKKMYSPHYIDSSQTVSAKGRWALPPPLKFRQQSVGPGKSCMCIIPLWKQTPLPGQQDWAPV